MGKLSELRKELKDCEDDVRIRDLEKEINKIEQWCIDNDKGNVKALTVFRIEAGQEDINKCSICQTKQKAPCIYKHKIYNGATRRTCEKCHVSLVKGIELYNSNHGTNIKIEC